MFFARYRLALLPAALVAAATLAWLLWTPPPQALEVTRSLEREWPRTDFSRRTVELSEIRSGGPPRDGIPAIDQPRFVGPAEADRWLDPREPVVVVELGGKVRAYPLQILIWHEIVNDRIAGTPVAVTFCPLCNATFVFDPRVAGRALDFGTTGRLRMSDLVMYDRQTESWWQQFSGEAIVGELAGTRLRTLPSTIASYADFKAAHPEGLVLSRETGHDRPYGRNPYSGYDRAYESPFFPREEMDPRLPPMERVIAVRHGEAQRVYPFTALEETPVINDELTGLPVVVFSKPGTLSVLDRTEIRGSRTVPSAAAYERRLGDRVLEFRIEADAIVDTETASHWDLFGQAVAGPLTGERLAPVEGGVHFAFAWLAFNPATEVYGKDSAPRPADPARR
jgi:hypothetical protein